MTYQLAQHQFLELDTTADGDPLALAGALALWLQASAAARPAADAQLLQLFGGQTDAAIADGLAEDLAACLTPPDDWCESRELGEWLERIECADLAAEAAQLRGLDGLAAALRNAVDAGVGALGRTDLVLVGALIANAANAEQRQARQPWRAIRAHGQMSLPEPSEAIAAAAVIDAWALGRLDTVQEDRLCQLVAGDSQWREAYRASVGGFALLQWRQAFATAKRVLGQVFLPHLGRGAVARFVATRTQLLLQWPGHPDESLTEGANFWGDAVTGTLRTDVRLLASDVHLAVQEALVLLQGDTDADVDLLEHAAKLLADDRLAAPLGRAASLYREGELDDGGQVDWQVWQIAQLRTELELAVRRIDSAALRQSLARADGMLRDWQAQHAFCLLSTEHLEELAERLGGAEGIWWLGALELDDFEVPTDTRVWERPQAKVPTARTWFTLEVGLGHMADAADHELKLAWKGPGDEDAAMIAPPKASEDHRAVVSLWSDRVVAAIELGGARFIARSTAQNRWEAALTYAQLLEVQAQGGLERGLGVEVDGRLELWPWDPDRCVGLK